MLWIFFKKLRLFSLILLILSLCSCGLLSKSENLRSQGPTDLSRLKGNAGQSLIKTEGEVRDFKKAKDDISASFADSPLGVSRVSLSCKKYESFSVDNFMKMVMIHPNLKREDENDLFQKCISSNELVWLKLSLVCEGEETSFYQPKFANFLKEDPVAELLDADLKVLCSFSIKQSKNKFDYVFRLTKLMADFKLLQIVTGSGLKVGYSRTDINRTLTLPLGMCEPLE